MTTTTVLFLCPHAAGKSLLAATYFRAAAGRRGLDVNIDVAGPEPDPVNMPGVTSALETQGYTIGWHPRPVESADVESADVVVSIGCDHSTIPAGRSITEWDVPLLSEDFAGAMEGIHRNAEDLALTLAS